MMSKAMDRAALAEYIRTTISSDPDVPIGDETALLSSGLVDSFSIVQLTTHLEKTYGVRIPSASMTIDHFESVARLARLIESLRA
jgi:acyl carrier protein